METAPAFPLKSPSGTSAVVAATDAATSDELHRYWVPPGLEIDSWSPELRASVAQLIDPLYRELVQAKHGLERSIGVTIVHLTWLEILDQLQIARDTWPVDPLDFPDSMFNTSRPAYIGRHLRLIGSKLSVSRFLLQLTDLKHRHREERAQHAGPEQNPPGPGSVRNREC